MDEYDLLTLVRFQNAWRDGLRTGVSEADLARDLRDDTGIPSYRALQALISNARQARGRTQANRGEALARGATAGATLGVGPAIARGIYGESEADRQAELRGTGSYMMGSMAGGLPVGAATGLLAMRAPTLLTRLAAGSGLGAAEGGTYGALESPDAPVEGGLLGTTLGGLLGPLGLGVGGATRRGARMVTDRMAGAEGPTVSALGRRLGGMRPSERAAQDIVGALETPDDLVRAQVELMQLQDDMARQGSATAPVIGDVLPRPLAAAATANTGARNTAFRALEDRPQQTAFNLGAAVEQLGGGGPRQSALRAEEVARRARSAAGRTAYSPLEQQASALSPAPTGGAPIPVRGTQSGRVTPVAGDVVDPSLRSLGRVAPPASQAEAAINVLREVVGDSRIAQGAWRKAMDVADVEGYQLSRVFEVDEDVLRTTGQEVFRMTGEVPDFVTLQALERSLRAQARQAAIAGEPTYHGLATRARTLRNAMPDLFGDEYQVAQATWRSLSDPVEAPEIGRTFWHDNIDSQDVLDWLRGSSPAGRTGFERSARDELLRRLTESAGMGEGRAAITLLSGLPQAKLGAVFTRGEIAQLRRAVRNEGRMLETLERLGSRDIETPSTLAAEAGMQRPGPLPVGLSPQYTAVRGALRALDVRMPSGAVARREQGAPAIAQMFTDPNPDTQAAAFRMMLRGRRPSLWDATIFGGLTGAGRAGTGGLLGGR